MIIQQCGKYQNNLYIYNKPISLDDMKYNYDLMPLE